MENQNDPSFWNNKGLEFYKEKNYTEALSCYERALEIRPEYAPAWYNRGIILEKLGNIEEAEKSYEKALQYSPENEIYKNALKKIKSNR